VELDQRKQGILVETKLIQIFPLVMLEIMVDFLVKTGIVGDDLGESRFIGVPQAGEPGRGIVLMKEGQRFAKLRFFCHFLIDARQKLQLSLESRLIGFPGVCPDDTAKAVADKGLQPLSQLLLFLLGKLGRKTDALIFRGENHIIAGEIQVGCDSRRFGFQIFPADLHQKLIAGLKLRGASFFEENRVFIIRKRIIALKSVANLNEGGVNIFYNIMYAADVDVAQKRIALLLIQVELHDLIPLFQGGEDSAAAAYDKQFFIQFSHPVHLRRQRFRRGLPHRDRSV